MTVINNLLLLKCEGNSTISKVKLQKLPDFSKRGVQNTVHKRKGLLEAPGKLKTTKKTTDRQ
jgi:hypothetical protein